MTNQWVILKLEDDWMKYRDSDKYDRRWQQRCNNCSAPCCMMPMQGYPYDYEEDLDSFYKKQDFFTNDFVIIRNDDIEGEINFDKELYVCPLNVGGKCMIYENRPSVCREWRCKMATSKYIGGGD